MLENTHFPMPVTTYARTAGAFYLVIAVLGAFSIGYVPSVILAEGDAAATAANLVANRELFTAGLLADVAIMIIEIALSIMLFILFKPISPTLSLIVLVSRLALVLVMAINLLIYMTPMILLTAPEYVNAFTAEQRQAAAYLLMEIHGYGIYLWGIFFGAHLAAVGCLTFRSRLFRRIIGIALLIGGAGYSLEGLFAFALIEHLVATVSVGSLLAIATIGELALAVCLLRTGPNVTAWEPKYVAL